MNLLSAIQIVAQGARSVSSRSPGRPRVKDREAADAFLGALLSSIHNRPETLYANLGGWRTIYSKTARCRTHWVRKDDAILGAFSSAILENASNHWKGQNLTTRREGQYLDNPDYAMAGTMVMEPVSDEEINILLTNLLPLNGRSGTQLDIARSVLTYFLKDAESVTAHINIQNDIEMVVEGGPYGTFAISGILSAIAIPAFIKYVRQETTEAVMNWKSL